MLSCGRSYLSESWLSSRPPAAGASRSSMSRAIHSPPGFDAGSVERNDDAIQQENSLDGCFAGITGIAFYRQSSFAQQPPTGAAAGSPRASAAQRLGPRVQQRTYHFGNTNEDLSYAVFVSTTVLPRRKGARLYGVLHVHVEKRQRFPASYPATTVFVSPPCRFTL